MFEVLSDDDFLSRFAWGSEDISKNVLKEMKTTLQIIKN